jgi:short-subunit dehydrogenase
MPLQVIQLDVSDDKPALDAINRIAKENGRIDVILNNAEYALVGPLEQTSMEETKHNLRLNFWRSESHADSNSNNERTKKR